MTRLTRVGNGFYHGVKCDQRECSEHGCAFPDCADVSIEFPDTQSADNFEKLLEIMNLEQQIKGYQYACDLLEELAENAEENDAPELLNAIEDLIDCTDFFESEKQIKQAVKDEADE